VVDDPLRQYLRPVAAVFVVCVRLGSPATESSTRLRLRLPFAKRVISAIIAKDPNHAVDAIATRDHHDARAFHGSNETFAPIAKFSCGPPTDLPPTPSKFEEGDEMLVIHPVAVIDDRTAQNSFSASRLAFDPKNSTVVAPLLRNSCRFLDPLERLTSR